MEEFTYESIMWEKEMKEMIIGQATVLYAKEVSQSAFPLRVVIAKEKSPDLNKCLYHRAYTAHVVVNDTGVSSEWLPLLSTQSKHSVHDGLGTLLNMLQEMMNLMLDSKPQPTDKEVYILKRDPFRPARGCVGFIG